MSVDTQVPPVAQTGDSVPPRRRVRSWRSVRISRPLAVVSLLVLVAYPLGIIVVGAFINGTPLPGAGADWTPTLEHIRGLASSHGTLGALWNSLTLAAISTVLGVVIGALIAWLAARTDVPMPRLVAFSGIVPMLVPGLIGAIGWTFLASPDVGYIPLALDAIGLDVGINIYSYAGMLFVFTIYNVSLAFIFVYGALQLTNPEMEDAANVHGATKTRAMLSVTMPLAKPAILSAVLLTFVSTMEDFPVAMILGYSAGIETLAARIFVTAGAAPPPVNENSAQAVLLMVVVLVLVTYQRRLLRGQSFATVTGKGVRHRTVHLGGAVRWVSFALVMLYLLLSVGLPFAALLLGALRPSLYARDFADLLDPAKLTTEPLQNALQNATLWAVAKNSFVISLLVAAIGVAFSLFIAHTLKGRETWASRVVRRIAMLPAAAPGVVLGLGMLWAYVTLPVTIYGTLAILVVAIIVRLLPVSVSSVSSSMEGVHADLEDAASVSGASRLRAVWWVTVPLLKAGLASTAVMLFILATREISMSVFLYTPNNMTFAIYLYTLWSDGTWSTLASMSFIFAAFTFAFVLLARRWLTSSIARS